MRFPDTRSDRESIDRVRFAAPESLFDLGIYLRRHRLIAGCVFAALVLGVIVGTVRPHSYTAKVSLLVGNRLGQSGPIAAEGERRALGIKAQQLLARRARLQAEIAGANGVTAPPELPGTTDDPFSGAILEGERQLFAARRRALEESTDKFRQEKALADQRVATLRQQVQLVGIQQKSIDREVEDLKSLVDRKLVPAPRLGDMQRTAATIASHRVEIESEIVRTEQSKNQADQRMIEFRNQRRSEVLAELQVAEAELREATTRRETLRAVAANAVPEQKFDAGMLANQAEIITSDALLGRVVQKLRLDADPSFTRIEADRPATERLSAAIAALQANVAALRVGPGSRLDVSVKARDPARAASIANAVADVYVDGQSDPGLRSSDQKLLGGGSDAQQPGATILRVAEAPARYDGPGLFGITAAAGVLGLVAGLCLAAALELFGGVRQRVAGGIRAAAQAPGTAPDTVVPVRRML